MFAVIQTGGKQYKVESSQTLLVNKLPGSAGETIQFDQILLLGGEGAPSSMDGASVSAEIIDQVKGEKVIIFKKKRRHTYRRKNGHRQQLTLLRIMDIAQGGKVLSKAEAKTAKVLVAHKSEVTEEAGENAAPKAARKAPATKTETKAAAPKAAKTSVEKTEGETAKKPAATKTTAAKPAAKKE